MALPHERGHNANHQQQEHPRRIENYSDRERNERDGLQQQPPHGVEHPDAVGSLLARALQHVMKAGIFKRSQIEPGGMLDQAQAYLARKLVGQTSVGIIDGPAQHLIGGRK